MEQIFKFIDDRGYFVSNINKPGIYNYDNDSLLGYFYNTEGIIIHYVTAFYRELRPVNNPPTWFLLRNEVVKHTITSSDETRKINVYHDDSVKIFDYGPYTNITEISAQELTEIMEVINRDKFDVNIHTYTLKK